MHVYMHVAKRLRHTVTCIYLHLIYKSSHEFILHISLLHRVAQFFMKFTNSSPFIYCFRHEYIGQVPPAIFRRLCRIPLLNDSPHGSLGSLWIASVVQLNSEQFIFTQSKSRPNRLPLS